MGPDGQTDGHTHSIPRFTTGTGPVVNSYQCAHQLCNNFNNPDVDKVQKTPILPKSGLKPQHY